MGSGECGMRKRHIPDSRLTIPDSPFPSNILSNFQSPALTLHNYPKKSISQRIFST